MASAAAPPPIVGTPIDPPPKEVPAFATKLDSTTVGGIGYRAMRRYSFGNVGLLAEQAIEFKVDAAIANAAGDAAALAWLRGFRAAMQPHASGHAYQNYIDADIVDWERAYYGSNYPRLRRVKSKYDPDNVFHVNVNIRPR